MRRLLGPIVHRDHVPFGHQAVYADIAAAAGKSHQLAQRTVARYGHCTFTPEETLSSCSG